MRSSHPLAVAAAALLALGGCAAPALDPAGPRPGSSDAPGAASPLDRLQRDLDAVRDAGVTGVQARLVTAEGTHHVAGSGVGDRTTGEPVPLDGHYRIGSNTKTFTATVVLQLVGEGRLALDDTVDDWLPGAVRGRHDGRRITVRQLLQHTSGLPNYTAALEPILGTPADFRRNRLQRFAPATLLGWAMERDPEFPPGTGWAYSNTNYLLAGMIIGRVTGTSWQDEVTTRIIERLGLTQTLVPGDDPELPHPHARGYWQFVGGGELVDATVAHQSWADAAGSIISTTRDVHRFYRALLDGELLGPDQLAAMQRTVEIPGGRYGLGLRWTELPCGGGSWSHTGDTMGYTSREGFTPDGRGVVVSASSTTFDEDAAARQERAIADLIGNALCGRA